MALKRLKVKLAAPAPNESTDEIPIIAIEGKDIQKYNDADLAMKAAEAEMKEIRPDIEEIAKHEIFSRSLKRPMAPTKSVKLQDDSGEVCLVSFVNKYSVIADVEAAEALFEEHDLDINVYVTEGVKASFDDSVFYDQDGNFVQEIYDDIRKAIQTIVAKRQLPKNPLETKKVVKPKPMFHEERFAILPSEAAQNTAFEVVPNQLMLKPVRPQKKK